MVVFADFLEPVLVRPLPMAAPAVRCGLVFSSLIFRPALYIGEALCNEFSLRTFRAAAIAGARECCHLWVVVLAAAAPPCFTGGATCRDLTALLDNATPDNALLVGCASRGCGVDPVPLLWLASLERATATSPRLGSDGCRDVEAVDRGLEMHGVGCARVHVGAGGPGLVLDDASDWTLTTTLLVATRALSRRRRV